MLNEHENDDNQESSGLDFFMLLTGFLLITMQLMQLKSTQRENYLEYDLVSLPAQTALFQFNAKTRDFEQYDSEHQRWRKQKPTKLQLMGCPDRTACLAYFGEGIAVKPEYQVLIGLPEHVSSLVNQMFVDQCTGQGNCRITAKISHDTVQFAINHVPQQVKNTAFEKHQ